MSEVGQSVGSGGCGATVAVMLIPGEDLMQEA